MKYRKLRIAWSPLCGILCLLLIALWVRSYWRADCVQAVHAGRTISLDTNTGVAFFCVQGSVPPLPTPKWQHFSTESGVGPIFHRNFWLPWSARVKGIQSPMWMPTIFVAALAGAPWLKRRFSLRTLLIGMTIVAVALGLIFALSR
jgi:hypothetical protein